MKNIFLIAWLLSHPLFGRSQSNGITVLGDLHRTDTLTILLISDDNSFDTVTFSNGVFRLPERMGGIYKLTIIDRQREMLLNRYFIASKGTVTINPDLSLSMEYPEWQDRYGEYNRTLDSIARATHQNQPAMLDATEKFILENQDNLTGVYVFTHILPPFQTDLNRLQAIYEKFSPAMQANSSMVKMSHLLEARRKLRPGAQLPGDAFKGMDVNGNPFSLAMEKGKYVLVDFWGSWCISCIRGFPQMKSYYENHKSQLEIIGIDCMEKRAAWEAGLKKYALPGIQLHDEEGGKGWVKIYGIEQFPSKILIGPNGRVVQFYVGETEEIYKKLDELLKNNK